MPLAALDYWNTLLVLQVMALDAERRALLPELERAAAEADAAGAAESWT